MAEDNMVVVDSRIVEPGNNGWPVGNNEWVGNVEQVENSVLAGNSEADIGFLDETIDLQPGIECPVRSTD